LNFAQVGIEYTYGQLRMYIQESPAQIHTPLYWNLNARSMTAPTPVLSPSSTLPPPSSHSVFIPRRNKIWRFSKMLLLVFLKSHTPTCKYRETPSIKPRPLPSTSPTTHHFCITGLQPAPQDHIPYAYRDRTPHYMKYLPQG